MRNLAGRSSRLRIAAALVAAGALVAGCSESAARLSGDGVDHDRMYQVAEDVDAAPSEIVEAGRAVDAAQTGSNVLVAYTVHNDTDEGRSAAAWRLYAGDGDTIAEEYAGVTDEGSAHPNVFALPEGFLVSDQDGPWWYVRTDGTRQRITQNGARMAAQPGDVPLDDGTPRMYRPATRTLFTAVPTPTRQWQGWAAADDGTVWMQGPGLVRNGVVPFFRSTAGRPWEPVSSYDPGKGQWVGSLALAAVGSRIVVPVLAQGGAPDRARLVALIVRPGAASADQPWQVLRPTREAAREDWFDVRVSAVDDTTALVGPWGDQQYLVNLADASWRAMDPPTAENSWSYEKREQPDLRHSRRARRLVVHG